MASDAKLMNGRQGSLVGMHPIEHLRYLARARGIDGDSLVREAAVAIGSLPDDAAMLVVVCRRLIEKHPTVAPLWWLCASVLTAPDPSEAAWELYERHQDDHPYLPLSLLPDPDTENVTLVEPVAISAQGVVGPTDFVDPRGPVWAVCPLGVRVHQPVLAEIATRGGYEIAGLDGITHVVDAAGIHPIDAARLQPDGPFAPELLRSGIV